MNKVPEAQINAEVPPSLDESEQVLLYYRLRKVGAFDQEVAIALGVSGTVRVVNQLLVPHSARRVDAFVQVQQVNHVGVRHCPKGSYLAFDLCAALDELLELLRRCC